MRQIVLDTETTGLDFRQGHRIIEIGCVELVNRQVTKNSYHQYVKPDREIDPGAMEVHGITNEFLQDKPGFEEVVAEFTQFIEGAELVIHNAAFDVGFINMELELLGSNWGKVEDHCAILDTLGLARSLHPGQKNTLDALCKRYGIDNSHRELHGALLDAEILGDVYLAMTGGQVALSLDGQNDSPGTVHMEVINMPLEEDCPHLEIVRATMEEIEEHERYLEALDRASNGNCLYRKKRKRV